MGAGQFKTELGKFKITGEGDTLHTEACQGNARAVIEMLCRLFKKPSHAMTWPVPVKGNTVEEASMHRLQASAQFADHLKAFGRSLLLFIPGTHTCIYIKLDQSILVKKLSLQLYS